jgi:hypothetical protein
MRLAVKEVVAALTYARSATEHIFCAELLIQLLAAFVVVGRSE